MVAPILKNTRSEGIYSKCIAFRLTGEAEVLLCCQRAMLSSVTGEEGETTRVLVWRRHRDIRSESRLKPINLGIKNNKNAK